MGYNTNCHLITKVFTAGALGLAICTVLLWMIRPRANCAP
jgi:hypothetical protein